MRKLLASLILLFGAQILAQTPPRAVAGFVMSGGVWIPMSTVASGGTTMGPSDNVALYCQNSSTHLWSPCPPGSGGGGGASFPGTNGVVVNTSTTASRNGTFGDIVALWASGVCTSGYLKFDGTCSNPTASSLTGGALGSAPYQSAPNTTAFITSPTLAAHTFVFAWQPSGSAIAPAALDLATYLASPANIGTGTPGTGAFSSMKITGLTSKLFLGTDSAGNTVAATTADLASFLAGLTGCATTAFAYVPADAQCESITGLPALPTGPNGVPQVVSSTPSGGVGQPAVWGRFGVPGRNITITSDTIVVTDSGSTLYYNSASPVTVTLTPAATLANNFSFKACNGGAGLVTLNISAGAFLPGVGSTFTIGTNQCDVFSSPDNVNWLPTGALFGQGTVTQTLGSGSTAMGTSAISSGTCATVITVAVTGVTTSDKFIATPSTDPTVVTGYAVSATGSLYIQGYPTAGNINFKVCNNTGGSLTPAALTMNWGVFR